MNGEWHAARGQRAQGTGRRAEERLAANGLRHAAKAQGTGKERPAATWRG